MKKRLVIKSEVLGFCMGVKNAVDLAVSARKQFPEKEVYTFGALIHNEDALSFLAENGVRVLEPSDFFAGNVANLKNSVVIIRAHGIEPLVEQALIESGAKVINATCPRVVSGQKKAEKNATHSNIILAGDKNHQELIAISGYAKLANAGDCLIVENESEAETVSLSDNGLGFCLIAQTTIRLSEYKKIIEALQKRIPDLCVFKSVCSATQKRQDALKELSKVSDAIVVIGGKNSANTKRLLQTALNLGKPAWLVQNENNIPPEVYGYAKIGVTAGASTPNFVIDKVVKMLEEY